jgi:N-methylhydantoinase A
VSSALSRGIGEYERFASSVLNEYVTPSVTEYLATLETAVAQRGFIGRLHLMHSAGGAMNI